MFNIYWWRVKFKLFTVQSYKNVLWKWFDKTLLFLNFHLLLLRGEEWTESNNSIADFVVVDCLLDKTVGILKIYILFLWNKLTYFFIYCMHIIVWYYWFT